MAGSLTEITATYLRERVRRDDWVIVSAWLAEPLATNGEDAEDEVAILVTCDPDELRIDQEYRWLGTWKNHEKYGRQFHAQSFVLKLPHGRAGVISCLRDAGEGLGFGPARAAKCWEIWGSDAVEHFRKEPTDVANALQHCGRHGISDETARKIAEKLNADAALESCTLDLLDVLTGRGFPRTAVRELVKRWGNRAAAVIRRDPYRMIGVVRGAGWKRCDAMYTELGLPLGRMKRQALAAWYAVTQDSEGNTWFPDSIPLRFVEREIGGATPRPEKAVERAVRRGYLADIRTAGAAGPVSATGAVRWVAEKKKADNERELAELVAEAMRESVAWPFGDLAGHCSEHQIARLNIATAGPVGILGGGPGTGKTYTVAALCQSLAGSIGLDQVAIGAPTGKAAVRVTETLHSHGLEMRARTWHSLLRGGVDGGFLFNRQNPLPFRVLIGDESSMVDTDLAAAIFCARPSGCLMLLVGDHHQLAPVGHGRPLFDLIQAGLPYGELTEIKRNSGGIVEACHAIRQGKRWQSGDNLRVVDEATPDGQIAAMLRTIQAQRAAGDDPVWDCQVVCPVNAKSPLARKTLNEILQRELNASGERAGTNPFRTGDKIVNGKNGRFPAVELDSESDEVDVSDRGEVYVANGELARVLHVEDRLTIAQLDNPRRVVKIPRGKSESTSQNADADQDAGPAGNGEAAENSTGTGCSWDLGYALSVHKSQGSEWPTVIVMVDAYPGARMVCSREWHYTAISRAKSQCVLIGQRAVVDADCRKQAIWRRKTFLKERVLLEQAKRELCEL